MPELRAAIAFMYCPELGNFMDDRIRNPVAPRRPEERPVQPTREAASAASNKRCRFRCFSRKLSADHIAFPAEILDRRPSGDRKNSETARCFAAVFHCSCGNGVQKGRHEEGYSASE